MRYLIVPEFIYIMLLCGGFILAFVSAFMSFQSIIKKRGQQHFVKWIMVLMAALAMVVMTTTGVIVANTMLGG